MKRFAAVPILLTVLLCCSKPAPLGPGGMTVTGYVRYTNGTPASSQRVVVFDHRGYFDQGAVLGSGVSDVNGFFSIQVGKRSGYGSILCEYTYVAVVPTEDPLPFPAGYLTRACANGPIDLRIDP